MNEHIVMIGANGWQHAAWTGEFYPDDLPLEWQLGYYGNEYPVVMIPASYWSQGEAAFTQWLEESDDSLRLILQWPAAQQSEQDKQLARSGVALLAERIAGILISVSDKTCESDWQEYRQLAELHPVCFDLGNSPGTEQREAVQTHFTDLDYGICWYGDASHSEDTARGELTVCRLAGEVQPKELRRILETLVKVSSAQRNVVLIVDGQPPEMQLMTNAGIILDLL